MFNLIPIFNQHIHWSEVKKIILALNKDGFTAYLAGGCVRDALLHRPPKDFDIATSAKPEEILQLFPNSNIQGKAFGVVVVSCSKGQVEIATFRKDGPYKDGRHPEYVEFLSDKEDSLRRDFTINALFYDLKTDKVIDYVNGIEDLQKKIIKTVGEPEKRFQEDHLRILRAIRFSVQLNFKIDTVTKETLFKMKDRLLEISRERIYEECVKILKTGEFQKAAFAFKELGLLRQFWKPSEEQDWQFSSHFWNQDISSYLMKTKSFLWMQVFYPLLIQKEKEVLSSEGRWASNFSNNFKEWKFPVAVIREMNDIFYSSCCLLGLRNVSLGKKLRIFNSEFSKSILFFSRNYLNKKKLNTDIIDKIEKEFIKRTSQRELPKPLVDGNDLKSLGMPEDKNMAEWLERLYNIQLEQQIQDKNELLKKLS